MHGVLAGKQDGYEMNITGAAPVVLGSSLTGLLVSHALSEAGITHTLIGGRRPPSTPRLGESLNEVVSPELWRSFADDCLDCFHVKSHICLLNGDEATMAYLAPPRRSLPGMADELRHSRRDPRYLAPRSKHLIHVDRAGFDPVVYDKVRSRPECRFIEARVSHIDYDRGSDRIGGLELDDGSRIDAPVYVFDASGPGNLLAMGVGIGLETISPTQRVVWTHYRREGDGHTRPDDPWWCYGTNMLRLDRERDGIDAISWLIPLGDSLSLGISVDDGEDIAAMGSDQLLTLLAQGFERRGIDYRAAFPDQQPASDFRHQYGIRERGHGANWLLVGGSFLQIWFPSASGLWTATAASGMVRALLDDPEGAGADYEAAMRRMLTFHRHLDQMVHGMPYNNPRQAYLFWSKWIAFLPWRFADYARIGKQRSGGHLLSYPLMQHMTRLFLRVPRLVQMFWLPIMRVRQTTALEDQATAFADYFRPGHFLASNLWRGLPHLFRRLRAPGD